MLGTAVGVKVEGLAQLEANLKLLAGELDQRKAFRAALREGGQEFLAAMKARVHRTSGTARHTSSGKLRKHLTDDLRVRFRWQQGFLKAFIGTGRMTAYIANFLEFGTQPHIVRAKEGKPLAIPGATHPVYEVHHPGASARPFIRPAFDSQKMVAIDRFKIVLAERIKRLLGKLA